MFALPIIWICIFSVVISDEAKDCSRFSAFMLIDSTLASEIVSLINTAKNLLEDSKTFASVKTRHRIIQPKTEKPMDCAEVQEINPDAKSGIHTIWPHSRIMKGPIDVYCDMVDDGGAWTVLQRRGDFNSSADYFYKDWESYKLGFGDREKDHWLGNDNIFALTNQRSSIVKFTVSDWEGNNRFATYDEFWIEDESRNYAMHESGYRGTAGDSLSHHNKMAFSTKDRDNDKHSKNCAVEYKGAWWYVSCHHSNLNGMYLKGTQTSNGEGVEWYHFKGTHYSMKNSVIKIRPKDFKKDSDASPL